MGGQSIIFFRLGDLSSFSSSHFARKAAKKEGGRRLERRWGDFTSSHLDHFFLSIVRQKGVGIKEIYGRAQLTAFSGSLFEVFRERGKSLLRQFGGLALLHFPAMHAIY